ncbi:MAG: DUF5119 domain-containing protein [Candidatus Cryptobacteroides sp.]
MKHLLTNMPLVLMLLPALISCRLDHLYYASSGTATVLVEPDWSACGLHPNGVSIYAYTEPDGKLYRRFPPVSAESKCYVKLPQGDFTLVVMNDTPEEFDGKMTFCGEENLDTFQARGVKDGQRSQKLAEYLSAKSGNASEEYCIVEPDTLAVSVVRGVHIAPEQIDYFYDRPESDISVESALLVETTPEPVVSQVNITAHVTGLKYARGTTISFLRGVAAGHCIGLGENSTDKASHAFILNNRTFDPGSDSDGTIRASFLSFGLVGDGNTDSRYILDINFILINGKEHPLSFDVTDKISIDVSLSLKISINLNLEITLPEVVGGDDEGGGFSTDVIEWEDEIIPIPM